MRPLSPTVGGASRGVSKQMHVRAYKQVCPVFLLTHVSSVYSSESSAAVLSDVVLVTARDMF